MSEITKADIRDKIKELGVEYLEKHYRVKYETNLNLTFEGAYPEAWEMLERIQRDRS
jgi:hypothetical protein